MEKTVFEMTQRELIELNTQYLKRIKELEEALQYIIERGSGCGQSPHFNCKDEVRGMYWKAYDALNRRK